MTASATAPQSAETSTASMSFLDNVMAIDLSVAKSAFNADPVEAGDHIVGVMSDFLIRINYLVKVEQDNLKAQLKKMKTLAREHEKLHNEGDDKDHNCAQFWKTMDEMAQAGSKIEDRMKLYSNTFWAVAEIEFPELNHERDACIRENFQLAWREKKSSNGILDALGAEMFLVDLLSKIPQEQRMRES